MVPSEPQNPGPKLSKSLVKNPLWVNRPVPVDGREEPARLLLGSHCGPASPADRIVTSPSRRVG